MYPILRSAMFILIISADYSIHGRSEEKSKDTAHQAKLQEAKKNYRKNLPDPCIHRQNDYNLQPPPSPERPSERRRKRLHQTKIQEKAIAAKLHCEPLNRRCRERRRTCRCGLSAGAHLHSSWIAILKYSCGNAAEGLQNRQSSSTFEETLGAPYLG